MDADEEKKFERKPQMPIKYEELMALKNLGQKYAYTDREVMLYACGIGLGADPMDEKSSPSSTRPAPRRVRSRWCRPLRRLRPGERGPAR